MSHESVMSDLRELADSDTLSIDPLIHIQYRASESDRAIIVLQGADLENMMLLTLKIRMPHLNSEERDRMFHFSGPLGTFSSRIALCYGLQIITRAERKHCDIVRAMRNAAAHGRGHITFDTPSIRNAVLFFIPSEKRPRFTQYANRNEIRNIFHSVIYRLTVAVGKPTGDHTPEAIIDVLDTKYLGREKTSLDRSREA